MAEELTKEVLHFLVLWDLWKVLKEGNMYHLNPEQKIHNFDINRGFMINIQKCIPILTRPDFDIKF